MMKTYHVRFSLNHDVLSSEFADSRFTEVTLRINAANPQDAMKLAYARISIYFGLEAIKEFSIHQF